jgi:hypothetical protein
VSILILRKYHLKVSIFVRVKYDSASRIVGNILVPPFVNENWKKSGDVSVVDVIETAVIPLFTVLLRLNANEIVIAVVSEGIFISYVIMFDVDDDVVWL